MVWGRDEFDSRSQLYFKHRRNSCDENSRNRRRGPTARCRPSKLPHAEHYRKNKRKYVLQAREGQRRVRAFIVEQKTEKTCMDCNKPWASYQLQFDHRPGMKKLCHIATIQSRGWSMEKIKAELEKCDLVCANCHAERTWRRRQKRSRVSSSGKT